MLMLVITLLAVAPAGANPAEADREFTFAVRLMQTGENDLATEALSSFVAQHPGDVRVSDARYYLALLARQRGDRAQARRLLAEVGKGHQVTEDMLNLMRGQLAIEAGDAKDAAAQLEKIDPKRLGDDASRAGWAYMLGVAYRALDNPQAAAQKFDQATEADSPVRGPALVELGKARLALDQPAAALDALLEATEHPLEPAFAAEARKLAADIAYSQKQYPRAVELYRLVIQHHQTSAEFGPALVGVLRSLYAAEKTKDLIAEYKTIATLLPRADEAEALYLLGAANVREGDHAAGAAALKQFYERFGSDHALSPEVAYMYAVCVYHTDLDAFEKWFEAVEANLDAMPHADEIRFLRAQGAVKREKPAEAIAYLTPLVDRKDSPFAKEALMQRAALREKAGQGEAAGADYALFIERYGEDAASVDAGRRAIDLAFNAAEYQRVADLAVPWLKREKLDPGAAESVRLKLALSLIKLNQRERAAAVLDALIDSKPSDQVAALTRFYRGLLLASQAKAPDRHEPDDTTKPAIAALEAAMTGPLPPAQQAEALDLIARLHRIAGRDQPAVDVYKKLRERRALADFDTATALWVGRNLAQRKEPAEALPWLRAVSAREDAPPAARSEAMFLTGAALASLNDHDGAIESFRAVVAHSQGYGDQGRLGLARSLRATGNHEEALNEYNGLLIVEGTEVQAAAWYESAMLLLDTAERLRLAGDLEDAGRSRDEARRRLNRIAIQFDLDQLRPMPSRALLTLGRIAAEDNDPPKARDRFAGVVRRNEAGPWRDIALAEIHLLDAKRGDAVFLLHKIRDQRDDPTAAADAAARLKALGES